MSLFGLVVVFLGGVAPAALCGADAGPAEGALDGASLLRSLDEDVDQRCGGLKRVVRVAGQRPDGLPRSIPQRAPYSFRVREAPV